ncbi:MAG: hypothetical protein C0179_00370, partial [Fervidicoccus sp.]
MRNSMKTLQKRGILLMFIFILYLLFILGNLAYLQIVKHSYYKKLAQQECLRKVVIKPERGTIYDRKLRPLAQEVLGGSIFLRPSKVEDATLLSSKLSPLLSLKEEELFQKLFSPYPLIPLRRDIDFTTFCKIREIVRKNRLSGIELQEERRRVYPNGALAAHILGFVNIDEEP